MSENDIVAEWLLIAYEDYDSALYLFENKRPKPLEIICYHCQQTVEKSLKAFLCAKDIEIPKTHDAGLLCHHCAELDVAFKDLQDNCDDMVVYATKTRYPNRVDIEEDSAKIALQQALAVYKFVSEKLEHTTATDSATLDA
jgi:HEPN domain-containing protein